MRTGSEGLRVDVVTIFPDYLAPLRLALTGQAIQRGDLQVEVHDLRRWTDDTHRSVDDAPFGGGGGMVMRPEPWWRALTELTGRRPRRGQALDAGTGPAQPGGHIVVPSPSGRRLNQAVVAELAVQRHLVICCGRYEGIDQRVIDAWADDVISLGDYVIAGGEAAALVMIEAVARLLPGVVGNPVSVRDDSFAGTEGLLEGPVYTRPATYQGLSVPPVLLSGDHAAITRWRLQESRQRTASVRPDLLGAPTAPHPAARQPPSMAD